MLKDRSRTEIKGIGRIGRAEVSTFESPHEAQDIITYSPQPPLILYLSLFNYLGKWKEKLPFVEKLNLKKCVRLFTDLNNIIPIFFSNHRY